MTPFRPTLLWLWLGLLGALLPLCGQQAAFRRFGLRDGLPQSQVTALLEDQQGFLWVGTNTGGVARLGASGFRTFAGPQGLRALFIRDLLDDTAGGIWVASQEGVSEIRGETVLNYGPAQGLDATDANTLGLDDEGRVLVGNRSGLFRLEAGRFEPVHVPAPWPGGAVRRLARSPSGGLWLVGPGGRLAQWDDQGLRLVPSPGAKAEGRIRDLKVDAAGQAWLLLEGALFRREGEQWHRQALEALPPAPRMDSLRFDPRGGGYQIALGADGLLVKEDGQRHRRLTAAMGLPRDRIFAALRDRRGVLWVGSDGDGLVAQALPGLMTLDGASLVEGKDMAAVTSILELASGRFLIGSSTGLYEARDGHGVVQHWTTRQGLPANPLWKLLADGSGGAWVGTDRGLARWQAGRVQPAGSPALARAAVLALIREGGKILVGTDQGLFELDAQGRQLSHLHLPPEAGDESIPNLLPYEGRLLLATSHGIWERRGGRLQKTFTDAPFANSTVTALTRDGRDRLWVGTMKGVYLWMKTHWVTFGIDEGLPDACINFIADVGQGRMAFGHNKGVSFLEGRTLHHLGRSQGLISEETNHDGFLLDSRGRLWIGMIGGVCLLENAHAFRNAPQSAPALLEVRWPGGSDIPSGGIQVPPRPDFLDFSFDTGQPLAPSGLQYQAYLEGVDEGWRPVGQGLTLQYRNLGAGSHRFRLRASQNGVAWTEAPPVPISVLPAWHERWPVRLLGALSLIALVGGAVWLRVHALALRARVLEETIEARTHLLARQNRALEQAHQQIKRNLEGRLKLLDMVTHDLRSPLTTILLTLDRLRDQPPEPERLLDMMEREANRIETLVRNLLDQSRSESLLQSLKLEPIAPAEVTAGFHDALKLKAEARGLAFHLDLDPATEDARILADASTLHQVMLNLFENALKFTPAGGEVGIRSRVDRAEDLWYLEVWDTGRGLDPARIEEILQPFGQTQRGDAAQGWGLGLSICQNILEAHGGELRIDSTLGHGARFCVRVPLAASPA